MSSAEGDYPWDKNNHCSSDDENLVKTGLIKSLAQPSFFGSGASMSIAISVNALRW
jgi:hypothetical protein